MKRRLLATGLLLAAMAAVRAAEPKFLSDDPLTRAVFKFFGAPVGLCAALPRVERP